MSYTYIATVRKDGTQSKTVPRVRAALLAPRDVGVVGEGFGGQSLRVEHPLEIGDFCVAHGELAFVLTFW
ncbi:MAG TPA: hypothetical protein VGX03_25060 [Candidatus Binatia bacterium]|nr:hypothetical protein [Candidatus Binatia bacterium]